VYNSLGVAVWHTNTHGNPGAFLWLQDTGYLRIFADGGSPCLWSSASC